MMDLDLSKAVDAASAAMRAHNAASYLGPNPWPADEFDCCAGESVRAALPHIIQALADQALAEAKADPGYPYAFTQSYDASRWLAYKAGEERA